MATVAGATHSRALGVACAGGSGLRRTTAQFEAVCCARLRLASYSRRTSIWWFAAYALSLRPPEFDS